MATTAITHSQSIGPSLGEMTASPIKTDKSIHQVKNSEKILVVIGKVLLVAVSVGLLAAASYAIFGYALTLPAFSLGALEVPSVFGISLFGIKGALKGLGVSLGLSAVPLAFSNLNMFKFTESNGEDCKQFALTALKVAPLILSILPLCGFAVYAYFESMSRSCICFPALG